MQQYRKESRGKMQYIYCITCTDHLRCWRVETLLIRVSVLGNEALENRNALWFFNQRNGR